MVVGEAFVQIRYVTKSRLLAHIKEAEKSYVPMKISNRYTMGCPPVRGDNPRALAGRISYVQMNKHGITILYHLHQCRPCTSRDILW